MTDRLIRRFQTKGRTSETHLMKNRTFIATALEGEMRDQGYVPLIDVSDDYKLNYVGDEIYEFVVTIQGVYVGDKAWEIDGVTDGKTIWKSTPTNRSEESSKNSESE